MTFFDRLHERIRATGGLLAVGLNPDLTRLPNDCREYDYPRRAFNRRMVDATHEEAAAYVVNPAFYEDSDGWTALAETVAYAHGKDVPVVLDGKWNGGGDGGTSAHRDLLDQVDAVTVSPFWGGDGRASILDYDVGAFVVCRTPNAGAADLQDRELLTGEESVAERVASVVAEEWSPDCEADVGLLVGGPAEALEVLRECAPRLPFFVVGGATTDPAVAEYVTAEESANKSVGLLEVSREVIYAGETAGRGRIRGQDAYASAARQSARQLKRQLNRYR